MCVTLCGTLFTTDSVRTLQPCLCLKPHSQKQSTTESFLKTFQAMRDPHTKNQQEKLRYAVFSKGLLHAYQTVIPANGIRSLSLTHFQNWCSGRVDFFPAQTLPKTTVRLAIARDY